MGTLPRRVLVTLVQLNRDRRRQAPRGLLLAMAALVLCMPMSYRAGTAFSHPHAFFQVFIDAATGHGHHDADELVGAQTARVSHQQPDTPALSTLTAPLEQAAGIPSLSLIVLLFFAADRPRWVWALARAPRGLLPAPELPPPRLAAS